MKENLTEVIRVGALFIVSCFPYVLASGLLPPSDVTSHGEEAWQVIFHVLFSNCGTYKMYNMYEKQRFLPLLRIVPDSAQGCLRSDKVSLRVCGKS